MMSVKILGSALIAVLIVCGLYFGVRTVHQGDAVPVPEVEVPVPMVEEPVSEVEAPVSTVEVPVLTVEDPVPVVEDPVPTVDPPALMPADDSDFVTEDVTDDSVSTTVDNVAPLVRPPEPPSGGLEYALKDVPDEELEEAMMAYIAKYYPLLLHEDEEVSQFDERTKEEYDRQVALFEKDMYHIERDIKETLRDDFSSIPPELLEMFLKDVPKELLDFLREEGIIE